MAVRVAPILAGLILAATCISGMTPAQGAVESVRYMPPRVSKCLLSRHPRFVDMWLRTLPGSAEEREVLKRNQIGIDTCFGINSDGSRWKKSYNFGRMRAGVVRALLQSRREVLTKVPPTDLVATEWYATDNSVPATTNRSAILANEIGVCLARKNWEGVRAIVLAVDSKMERRYDLPQSAEKRELRLVNAELDKMISLVPSCVPEGSKLTLNRISLRSLLEETAFHALGGGTFADANAALRPEER